MATSTHQNYALAIHAPARRGIAPVVYDLTADSIEIGSAEDNHIVLSGPGVEPYHLAMRQVGSQLCALVDLNIAKRHGETVWLERRSDDNLFCPEHGLLARIPNLAECPLCAGSLRPLWLLRPLQSGDVFPIGKGFRATILNQASARQGRRANAYQPTSPWPDSRWLENPPRQPTLLLNLQAREWTKQPYPLDDSNLWVWSPSESPFPVFIHQRANRFAACHAINNSNREVGGLLLGHVYTDSQGTAYPVISHAIPARFANEMRGHLTFTRETWLDLINQRENHHPDEEVVGWYHTHPGLGIFLSEWDLLIHRHFFRQPWQVALVIDPRDKLAGFFVWSKGDILDPQRPHQLFTVADAEEGPALERRPRIRIRLGGQVQ